MDYETLRIIGIISVIANILFIPIVNFLHQRVKFLTLGGLYGIEKASGVIIPEMGAETIRKYINFCHDNYEKLAKK